MSLYATLYAQCYSCRRLFGSNPRTVPSVDNEPVCRACVDDLNRRRVEIGLPPWPIADDAYEGAEVDG